MPIRRGRRGRSNTAARATTTTHDCSSCGPGGWGAWRAPPSTPLGDLMQRAGVRRHDPVGRRLHVTFLLSPWALRQGGRRHRHRLPKGGVELLSGNTHASSPIGGRCRGVWSTGSFSSSAAAEPGVALGYCWRGRGGASKRLCLSALAAAPRTCSPCVGHRGRRLCLGRRAGGLLSQRCWVVLPPTGWCARRRGARQPHRHGAGAGRLAALAVGRRPPAHVAAGPPMWPYGRLRRAVRVRRRYGEGETSRGLDSRDEAARHRRALAPISCPPPPRRRRPERVGHGQRCYSFFITLASRRERRPLPGRHGGGGQGHRAMTWPAPRNPKAVVRNVVELRLVPGAGGGERQGRPPLPVQSGGLADGHG